MGKKIVPHTSGLSKGVWVYQTKIHGNEPLCAEVAKAGLGSHGVEGDLVE